MKVTPGSDSLFTLHPGDDHGVPRVQGIPDVPRVVHNFGDLDGVQHMLGRPGELKLMCEVDYFFFSDYQSTMDWVNELYRKAGQLTGEILVSGNVSWTSQPATFDGFLPTFGPINEGSGQGLMICGLLLWTLRGPYIAPEIIVP